MNNDVQKQTAVEVRVQLLRALIDHPYIFALIEPQYADDLTEAAYFSLETYAVTAAGRDYLALNEFSVFGQSA